jgi:hypothetical protein
MEGYDNFGDSKKRDIFSRSFSGGKDAIAPEEVRPSGMKTGAQLREEARKKREANAGDKSSWFGIK